MKCKCVEKLNKALAASDDPKRRNTEIDVTFQLKTQTVKGKRRAEMVSTLHVPTREIDEKARIGRKRLGCIRLLINYCPLCGKKL